MICNKCQVDKLETDYNTSKGELKKTCRTCHVAWNKEWRARNNSKVRASKIRYAEKAGKEKMAETAAKCYEKHKDKILEGCKVYYESNTDAVKKRVKAWQQANRATKRLYDTVRQRRRREATPTWLTKQDWADMRALYKQRGKSENVDHIIPLLGKNVSGLHVPWNLQILSESANKSKGNRI